MRMEINGIRQLDAMDRQSPDKEKLKSSLRGEDLIFHIRQLDPETYNTEKKKPKGNKTVLVDELFRLLEEHIDDGPYEEDPNINAEEYRCSPFQYFDEPYPVEFGKFVSSLPLMVSVGSQYGWNHLMTRGPAATHTATVVDSPNVWRVSWGERMFTIMEWNNQLDEWDNLYGSLTTQTKLLRAPIKQEDRKYCWRNLGAVFQPHEYAAAGGKAIAELFRKDIFDNVVTFDGKPGSMCQFHVDHIFPHARGGKCCQENYMGLHYLANTHKKAHILQSLDPTMMQVGFNSQEIRDLFFGLVACEEYEGRKTRGAKTMYLKFYIDILESQLNSISVSCSDFVTKKRGLQRDGMSSYTAFRKVLDDFYRERPCVTGIKG